MATSDEQRAAALEHFTEYFVRNYPGPHTIICDPKWHAPKIFRAAEYALQAAAQQAPQERDLFERLQEVSEVLTELGWHTDRGLLTRVNEALAANPQQIAPETKSGGGRG